MDILALKVELVRRGMTLEALAHAIGINPASLYRKMYGKSDFLRDEIYKISKVLDLNDEQIIAIFFARFGA